MKINDLGIASDFLREEKVIPSCGVSVRRWYQRSIRHPSHDKNTKYIANILDIHHAPMPDYELPNTKN